MKASVVEAALKRVFTGKDFSDLTEEQKRNLARRVHLQGTALEAGRALVEYQEWWPELAPLGKQERDYVRSIVRNEHGVQGQGQAQGREGQVDG